MDIWIEPLFATAALAVGIWLFYCWQPLDKRAKEQETAYKIMCASGVFSKTPFKH